MSFVTNYNTQNGHERSSSSSKGFMDSGATVRMCNDRSQFQILGKTKGKETVPVGKGYETNVFGVGNIRSMITIEGKSKLVQLDEVLFVPGLMCNLLSVSKIRKRGLQIIFDTDDVGKGYCKIIRKDNTNTAILQGIEVKQGLYEVNFQMSENETHKFLLTSESNQNLWHELLGHVGHNTVRHTVPLVRGIHLQKVLNVHCEDCKKGKSTRHPRPEPESESKMATEPLDLKHSDFVGPMKVGSCGGARYYVTLYDDSSAL